MSLQVGIVGLPNAGKSTLFNALASRRLAETAPRPFTTIECQNSRPGLGFSVLTSKTATRLLSRLKTLERVYKNLNNIDSEKLRKVLVENENSALMAKKLAKIVKDVPLKLDLEKCRLGNLDRANVHILFDKLKFRSLIPRLSNRSKNLESRIKSRNDKKRKVIQSKLNYSSLKSVSRITH